MSMTQIEAEAMLKETQIALWVIAIGGIMMCVCAYFVMKAISGVM